MRKKPTPRKPTPRKPTPRKPTPKKKTDPEEIERQAMLAAIRETKEKDDEKTRAMGFDPDAVRAAIYDELLGRRPRRK